jgi:hypothetical protein
MRFNNTETAFILIISVCFLMFECYIGNLLIILFEVQRMIQVVDHRMLAVSEFALSPCIAFPLARALDL